MMKRMLTTTLLGAAMVCVPLVAAAHDGDALPTAQHFPIAKTEPVGNIALSERQRPRPAPVSAWQPSTPYERGSPMLGADRLSVPGNPAFGRLGTP